MQKRLECNITGRVQMVMFRDFTCRKARTFGLVGAVENMNDGSVRAIIEGDEIKLRKLLKLLKKGSIFARVDNVKDKWTKPTGEFSSFHIV